MKGKFITALCTLALAGSLAFAAEPAAITDAGVQQYTNSVNESVMTVRYPKVRIAGNDAAAAKIMEYFADQEQKAAKFFNDHSAEMPLTEERSYEVMLNDGKYISILDEGYMRFKGTKRPTTWKNGVTFDAETGEQLAWQDLIQEKDAKAFTLKNINQTIFLSKHTLSRYFDGLTSLPTNYYLDKGRVIHFVFNPNEIAPDSSGIIDIDMRKAAK